MKKTFIKIASLVLLMAAFTLTLSAEEGTGIAIGYTGSADKFIVSDIDAFSDLPKLLPGDSFIGTLQVRNISNQKISVYLSSDGAKESELSQITLTLLQDDMKLFEGTLADAFEAKELGVLESDETRSVTYQLSVPAATGNEFSMAKGTAVWRIAVSQFPQADVSTGDGTVANSYMILFSAGGAGIITLLYLQKRKEAEHENQ